ncbi:MAG: MOSC domain-containing protein [Treponemataceae bacterium]
MKKALVLSVNASQKKGTIKTPLERGFFKVGHGLVDDAHANGSDEKRQVSLLAQESIDTMISKGITNLTAGSFAENITTQGLILHTLPLGTRLKIGVTVHEVTQIGKECHAGCAIQQDVGSCIMPTQGIFTKVIEEGFVQAGDEITVIA